MTLDGEQAENLATWVELGRTLREKTDRELAAILVECEIYLDASLVEEALISEIICRLHRAGGGASIDPSTPHAFLKGFYSCAYCCAPLEHPLHHVEDAK